jgi:hypothetical protein
VFAALFLLGGLKYLQANTNATLHPDLLVKALAAMAPETTLDRFHKESGIASRSVAKGLLGFLASNNIGMSTRGMIKFSGSDRLYAAMLALRMGCDIEHVSGHLSWRDFEKLASEVLGSFGYRTQTNVRLTKPRMEIDVVGVSTGFAVAVDCKHWKRSNLSSIVSFSKKQAARAHRLLKHDKKISLAVPVIMTLHSESVSFAGGVPVVPVHKFKSFVMELKGNLSEIYVAGYDSTSIAM